MYECGNFGRGRSLPHLRRALPQVYGYLLPRCGSVVVAEDLTAEAFMAAVAAMQQGAAPEVNVAWLIGVARDKLVDHWRRQGRDERQRARLRTVDLDDPWEEGSLPGRPHCARRTTVTNGPRSPCATSTGYRLQK